MKPGRPVLRKVCHFQWYTSNSAWRPIDAVKRLRDYKFNPNFNCTILFEQKLLPWRVFNLKIIQAQHWWKLSPIELRGPDN
jgi:hypothetical protein